MLPRSLPQGSEAISFQNTLFRVSELCWVKAVRLSVPELVVRLTCLGVAVAWVFAMKSAKGDFVNVEFLLAALPLAMAWPFWGSHKIGCTGDFEEAYDSRGGLNSRLFRSWIDTLRKREPDWLHLKGSNYDLLFNPNRIAWIRPCVQWSIYPLFVIACFVGYLFLIGQKFNVEGMPVFDDLQILLFPGGTSGIRTMSYLVIGLAVVSFALSIKRSVEVCGTGGVQDVFPVSAADQNSLLNLLAGSEVQSKPVRTVEARVAKAPAAAAKSPEPPPAAAKEVPTEASVSAGE